MTNFAAAEPDPIVERARARLGMVLQDKWRLDALLGVGGMAAVYAATHRNGKRVAVKMMHKDLSENDEVKGRFLQEGYAANAIQHDGAVSVLDDDLAPDGSAFIVMELLEGDTIEGRWEKAGKRMAPREVLAIVDQVLDVLAAAHAKNVVHRDIKPENLFLTKQGLVKVLDFGIARVMEARQQRQTSTRAGTVMGTPAFMAPEQALAHWDEVDGRTDLWALGATMFTLLTGQHVHEGSTANEQLIKAATTHPPSIAQVAPDVPPAVRDIVDRALAFEQARRWPDALAMQQAVQAALSTMGGAEPLAVSGRRTVMSSPTMPSASGTTTGAAATMLDTTRAESAKAAWEKERDAHAAEATRMRASIAGLTQRYGASKKGSTDALGRLEAVRAERSSLEQQFKKQTGTRTAAVEEARKVVRVQMVTLARRAIGDRPVFGADFDGAREHIAKLDAAAEAARRDVDVHARASAAYDPRAMRTGIVLMGVAAALLLALIIAPIVWRATMVAPPPVLTPPAGQTTSP
ncbi:MAG TPA: serine/threonine-protein kinase [Polyangiaceae bacterium]